MFIGAAHFHGTARIAVLGASYSIAFGIAACAMGGILSNKLQRPVIPSKTISLALSTMLLGVCAWVVEQVFNPQTRVFSAAVVIVVTCLGIFAYLLFHYVRGERVFGDRAEEPAL